MNKKTLIGVGLALATLSTLSFAATKVAKMDKQDFSTIQSAVESNNYNALPDDVKTRLTEAEFAKMVARQADHAALESALASNDYAAFKNAMIAQIPDETEFNSLVAMHKSRAESAAKIESAVKNNDFAAFKSAMEAQKALKPAGAPDDIKKPVISDEKLQKKFDSMVEYYTANGTLPEKKEGFGGGRGPGFGGGHGGPRN